MFSPTDGVSCALCHTDRLHVPLSLSFSLLLSFTLSLRPPPPALSDTCSVAQAAWREWRGEDGKGGLGGDGRATYMGGYEYDPRVIPLWAHVRFWGHVIASQLVASTRPSVRHFE